MLFALNSGTIEVRSSLIKAELPAERPPSSVLSVGSKSVRHDRVFRKYLSRFKFVDALIHIIESSDLGTIEESLLMLERTGALLQIIPKCSIELLERILLFCSMHVAKPRLSKIVTRIALLAVHFHESRLMRSKQCRVLIKELYSRLSILIKANLKLEQMQSRSANLLYGTYKPLPA